MKLYTNGYIVQGSVGKAQKQYTSYDCVFYLLMKSAVTAVTAKTIYVNRLQRVSRAVTHNNDNNHSITVALPINVLSINELPSPHVHNETVVQCTKQSSYTSGQSVHSFKHNL